jgi:hypothetical protein
MSLTKLSLGKNTDVTYKLFPPRESLVSGIPAGDGNIEKLFLQCMFWGNFFQTLNAIAKKLYIFKHFAKSKTFFCKYPVVGKINHFIFKALIF